MNSPEQIPPQRDAKKPRDADTNADAEKPRRRPAPIENVRDQTPAWLEFFTSDPRVTFAVAGLALWMLLSLALWIANNLTWPAYYLMRGLDRITGAAALPIAPFIIWTIWGGVFGGLLGNWLLAPVYGGREYRSLPLLVAFLLMSAVGLLTWAFVP